MASKAHCAFCFECLAASFERRQPLNLAQVEELWEGYQASKAGHNLAPQEESQDEEDDDDADMADTDPNVASRLPPTTSARPAAISRLLSSEQSSAASSSSSLGSSGSSNREARDSSSGATTPASSSTSVRSRLSLGRKSKGSQASEQRFPLFVTWNTVSRAGADGEHNKTLRGCIGTFEAQKLESGLRAYALTSAFEDVRFQPIPASQLQRLSVHVTLLTDFSPPSSDPMAWTLGQHGLRISFTHRGRRLGSTYLPDVAPEQGWTRDETLASLMRKAGWSGSDWRKAWREGNGELVTYEGKQVGLLYDEWRAWRDWADQNGAEEKPLN